MREPERTLILNFEFLIFNSPPRSNEGAGANVNFEF